MNFKSIIKNFALFSLSLAVFSACEKEEEKKADPDTLSVTPTSAISFKASDNEPVKLSVKTNVADWSVTAPEWITAKKESDALIINALDNDKDARLGRIEITAGSADPVRINVSQSAAGEEVPGEGVAVVFNKLTEGEVLDVVSGQETVVKASISIEKAVDYDIEAEIIFDKDYLKEFIFAQQQEYSLFPEEELSIVKKLTIKAGKTSSEEMSLSVKSSAMDFSTGYLIPLRASVAEGSGAFIKRSESRVNYVLMRTRAERTIKNVVYFEVNDSNPLNAIEWLLEDGTPFIDAVVLFAANINYNSGEDRVYLHNNPNVQALLDETDVYLQPLRKKGIKVYLGLLGNHDPAGLCQLSDWGAAEWSKEVAEAVKQYKLDGVSLDDEYSASPISNIWFTSKSGKAGSRLMYELKKAMKKACYWPTEVSYYVLGALQHNVSDVVDQETKESHSPSSFVDFYVGDYGTTTRPYADFTMANCCGASIQLNYGESISESRASTIKSEGFGWCMWFAFDPSGTGSVSSNVKGSFTAMSNAAKGFYGQKLVKPTGVYKKKGEGKYDPVRYDLNF